LFGDFDAVANRRARSTQSFGSFALGIMTDVSGTIGLSWSELCWRFNQDSMLTLNGGYMRLRLTLVMVAMLFGASSSVAQEVGDEKEPELRAELMRLVKDDQKIRGEFNKFRREHGLFGIDNKSLNEKLDKDSALKKGFQDLALQMQQFDDGRLVRMKEIIAKYGWPGRSLVGTEAATAAYLIVSHAVRDVAFKRSALEAMKKLPPCEVENTQLGSLTDRVLLAEGKKQLYGTMIFVKPDGTFAPNPIEDEANVDKRRAELGLQPLAEYIRRSNKAILGK